ncbi:hypothetical protein LINPERPRIM_LOCUS22914 [Linum perenne]
MDCCSSAWNWDAHATEKFAIGLKTEPAESQNTAEVRVEMGSGFCQVDQNLEEQKLRTGIGISPAKVSK